MYIYEKDMALKDLRWSIYYETQPNQILYILYYMYKKDLVINDYQW